MLGVPNFVFIQWVAPFVSEFPEKVSAFYWARTVDRASMALMNMVSSNINQWTLLAAMLPIVFSISRGAPSTIGFDSQQELELLMTLGQSLVGALFLINMELAWWEAAALFVLWVVQFALSPIPPSAGLWGTLASHIHRYVTLTYLVWAGVEIAAPDHRPAKAGGVSAFRRNVAPAMCAARRAVSRSGKQKLLACCNNRVNHTNETENTLDDGDLRPS